MKKIALICALFLFTGIADANNVIVESMNDINGENIKVGDSFQAKVMEEAQPEEDVTFSQNSIISGKIVRVEDAKRGKRNAYIVICPISYTNGENTVVTLIKDSSLEAKVIGYSKKDFKEMGLNAGLAVGGYFIKGAGQIFYFSKGLLKPEEDKSRIGTAVHNVYENSPFVYIEKGKDIDIKTGDYLVLKFYHTKTSKNDK